MEDKQLTPSESIEVIQQMINNVKSNFTNESSFYYLFWGWLLLVSALLHFFLLKTQLADYSYMPWPVFSFIGMTGSMIHALKRRQAKKNETYLGNFMKVFFTTGCLLFILGIFFCVSNNISPNPFVMLFSGFYAIVSGRLLQFKPFIFGGVIFILLSIIANYVLIEIQLLLIAAGIVLGYLVPGYLLRSKYNRNNTEY